MKTFGFSKQFRLSTYEGILSAVGAEIEAYRMIAGINIKDMMAELHISHPILKKFRMVCPHISYII